MNIRAMTESELEKEIDSLERVAEEGELTVIDADRLAACRRALDRIKSVKSGKNWY